MCSSWLQLAHVSRDLLQAEKINKHCYVKAGQIHKMTLKIVLDEQSCILSENSYDFVNFYSFI